MNILSNIFGSRKQRKSIPKTWCGLWTDKNGKQLIIETTKHDFYIITILDKNGKPFEIDLLGESMKKTRSLTANFSRDTNGNPFLQVEAGTNEIGPTYDLYFLTLLNQEMKLAKNSDDIEQLIIKPKVGMGLYYDWEDDLGVPWAFPLENFKKKKK